MGRVLIVAERDTLFPALIGALCPGDAVQTVSERDLSDGVFSDSSVAGDVRLLVYHLPETRRAPPLHLLRGLLHRVRIENPRVRVLTIYEHPRRALAGKLLRAGGDALLEEPFGLDELRRVVLGLLAEPAPPRGAPSVEFAPRSGARSADVADLDALAVFVRGLAHEVNNPLTTIRGFLQLLLHANGRGPKDAETQEAYRTMEAESRRIAELIQELEYFSGVRRPARTPIDFAKLVPEALKSAELNHVTVSLGAGDLTLLADREQLQFALRHLFGAVPKLAPGAPGPAGAPAQITAALARVADDVVLTVTLHGASDPRPERLLIPAWGTKGGPEARRSLACAFGIVRAHGGEFTVASSPEGLVFRMSLPARPSAAEAERVESA